MLNTTDPLFSHSQLYPYLLRPVDVGWTFPWQMKFGLIQNRSFQSRDAESLMTDGTFELVDKNKVNFTLTN